MTTPTSQTPPLDLEDYRWLVGDDAAPWLSELAGQTTVSPAVVERLRRQVGAVRAHLLLQQVTLRERAAAKFPLAARMFFSPVQLEQATDHWIAQHKAQRYSAAEHSVTGPVCDLCCGIGGDLIGLAARGPSVGVDRDPVMAILAEANLRVALPAAVPSVTIAPSDVRVLDVTDRAVRAMLADGAAWHLDPDRRPGGKRTSQLEFCEPSVAVIEELLRVQPRAAIKLAPAAEVPDDWAAQAELEWISRARECRQLVAWFGDLAGAAGQRRATVLGSGLKNEIPHTNDSPRTLVGLPGQPNTVASSIGRYLFEPDAAVLAAELDGALASEHGLQAIAPRVAYLTGDKPLDDPALACFEVTDVMAYHARAVKQLLRERGIGILEVKKRGVPLDPAAVRRELRVSGDQSATLLLARIANRVTAILARRVK